MVVKEFCLGFFAFREILCNYQNVRSVLFHEILHGDQWMSSPAINYQSQQSYQSKKIFKSISNRVHSP